MNKFFHHSSKIKKSRGQTLVEFAMVAFLFFFMVYGLMAAGFWATEASDINGAINVQILPTITNPNNTMADTTALNNAVKQLQIGLFNTHVTAAPIGSLCPTSVAQGQAIVCLNPNYTLSNGAGGYVEMEILARPSGFILPGSNLFSFPLQDIVYAKQEVFAS